MPDIPATLERSLFSLLSPGRQRAPMILIYHRVLRRKDALLPSEVDAAEFESQLQLLKSIFNVIPLLDAVRLARAGELPPRAACITFDDGYADNAELALPLLRRHGLHATFFIAAGFLDGGRMWNDCVIEIVRRAPGGVLDASRLGCGRIPLLSLADRQRAISILIGKFKYLPMAQRSVQVRRLAELADCVLPEDLMMSSAQVRQLHRCGMGIGAHTVRHPILARTPLARAQREISEGRRMLQGLIGEEVSLFAYPNGKPGIDYGREHVAMVRELGFEGAVSTAWGAAGPAPDVYQLPRFTPWDRSRRRFLLRLAANVLKKAPRA
ncbi:polysaccharide deacetylase family protein [Massilia endophytica]|uniref:polysaccharide deacetylase family protein n=1 Tax=Massilia endophytica TaxID=2899220 RepID=UPI001E4DDD44|nr:polysaccharide deacetylase family protein [Massilia endophytica]UGQ46207.1 polysaccharide deacetylase family protein [Massilia endophytica]